SCACTPENDNPTRHTNNRKIFPALLATRWFNDLPFIFHMITALPHRYPAHASRPLTAVYPLSHRQFRPFRCPESAGVGRLPRYFHLWAAAHAARDNDCPATI